MSKTPRRPRAVPFTIRPARSADKKSVLAFTKDTFGEFRDYIPFIWGRWLKDRGGYFWVAESRGRAVGIAKLTFHSPDEAWMEGLRVNPHQRSKGIAHALHKECLDAAAGRKVRVVRFATNSENISVHHLAAEFGFQRAASFGYFFAEPQAGEARPPFVMSPELLPQIHKFIWASDFRKASAGLVGLHDISWVWKELTEERIKWHLQKGEVLAYLGPGGAIDALAIVAGLAGGEERWISYLDGKPSAVQELALALRGWGDPLREIEGLFPEPSVVVSILEEVGYQRGYEPRMWIFEKRFGPEEG